MGDRDWIRSCADELQKIRADLINLYSAYMIEKDQKDGMTHVQAVLLRYLLDKESSTVSATADYLGVTMAAVSSLVDRLIRNGLLNRDRSESDRRVVYISLTPRGKEVIQNHLIKQRKRIELLMLKMGRENTEFFLKAQVMLRDTLEQLLQEKDNWEKTDEVK